MEFARTTIKTKSDAVYGLATLFLVVAALYLVPLTVPAFHLFGGKAAADASSTGGAGDALGFPAGPLLTGVFYSLLTIWSLAIAYLIVVVRPRFFHLSFGGGASHGSGVIIPENHTHDPILAHQAQVEEHIEHFTEDILPHMEVIDRSAPSNLPIAMATSAFTHEAVAQLTHEPVVAAADPLEGAIQTLENAAHEHNILLSSDAMRLVVDHAGSPESALATLLPLIERAKASYPREDGWIILNRERMLALFTEPAQPKAPEAPAKPVEPVGAGTLAEAIVTGNTVRAYQLLGDEPLRTLADTAEAFDTLIRARQGQGVAPQMLTDASAQVSTEKLKSIVSALVTAIDGTYEDTTAAVKLAVIKALKVVA